jgi:hypothetical protein
MKSNASHRCLIEPLESRQMLTAAPFTVGGSPFVHAQDFRITTFASGLNFPNGMTRLPDGSLLVSTSIPAAAASGGYFGPAVGQLVRLVDNGSGTAIGAPQVLASGLPPFTTDVRVAGKYVLATSAGSADGAHPTIHVFAMGKRASSPLTLISTLTFSFPQPWMHLTYALETRPTPHTRSGSYDIFFNVGSQSDSTSSPADAAITLSSSDGTFAGNLHPDSIYMLTMAPGKHGTVSYRNLIQVATGLRNAAGIAIQPGTGDLYFEDNGINGGPNGDANPQLSADTLNKIPFAQIGNGSVPDFGFAHSYIVESTGARVGSGAMGPLAAFTPVDGSIAEGPQDIAHAPAGFPAPLNHGVFLGFYGQGNYTGDGTVNTQNPVSYYDSYSGQHFDFVSNDESAIGHPVGWLSTKDSLFFSDLAPDNTFTTAGTGAIYQIQAKPRTSSITGTVFEDFNGDGVKGAKEPGLAGQTVYIDYNGSGNLDAGDPVATTDARGNYVFSKLPLSGYRVNVVVPNGHTASTPTFRYTSFAKNVSAGLNFGLM